jgi:hypothetical protein
MGLIARVPADENRGLKKKELQGVQCKKGTDLDLGGFFSPKRMPAREADEVGPRDTLTSRRGKPSTAARQLLDAGACRARSRAGDHRGGEVARAGAWRRSRKRRRGRRVRLDGAGQGKAAPSPGGGRRDACGEDLRGTRWHSDEKSEPEEGKGNRGVQEVRKGTRNT